ncbi:hypothetical protein DIU31_031735 [Mucilaginibacter rubeus]|uniref:Uncharacterized protein n=1 Tax=Mucilaginibacter rubeus TaxID=2027860 RepID=A0AAE6MM23_9SPHI|nr:hypothetical protein [Mucilaginibacter gossypii]QEM07852.1 hypothetical protein DIU31_031735 [Mucilaginibacter rubeus]QEM20304.1 hypothetical protein DIU38_031340 [Mucilaginibacter gossypii]QTE42978.1 hypothetical protein J3L19_29325 [Mucilaginibacter rubeus]QTE49579.1 hypothetical protein J3L21_29285 [Mucilaginibacter rubeus]QTE54675.1 hypothetical protein J3L23_20910 [Mucilaginibacter rubeus]
MIKKYVLLTFLCSLLSVLSYGQGKVLNIPELLQLVSYSKSEHTLQTDARDKQATVTTTETANKTLLGKFKDMYRTLQNRYSTLGTAITAANIGIEAEPMVNSIIRSQSQLVQLAQKNPAIIALAYQTEIDFAEHSQMLIRYLAGLIISIGDVNQMKSSDRKLLFDYVITELSNIEDMSNRLVRNVQFGTLASLLHHVDPFDDFVYEDQHMISDILTNAKYLKQ